jgi:hypothetical protein
MVFDANQARSGVEQPGQNAVHVVSLERRAHPSMFGVRALAPKMADPAVAATP